MTSQECRQELALEEVRAMATLVKAVDDTYWQKDVELAIPEMGKRSKKIVCTLEGLKGTLERLQEMAEETLSTTQL